LPEAYDNLAPQFRAYVDALLAHAQTALWPERRAALESFYRGIARSPANDLRAAAEALGLDDHSDEDIADLIFRRVLTAYLNRLDESAITNPDQAEVYRLSLDPDHLALAERWVLTRSEPTSNP
jgi:hypothetical protein